MQYDIFFSISQTPVNGHLPSEGEMFRNFFHQVEAADALGYEVAWLAESHLSSQVQKANAKPVIPHWEGEVGLNVDFLQLSHQIFRRTKNIQTGSAIMNILCMGGPVAAAERVAAFAALHGLDPAEQRSIHVGFAAGRFDFMNAASGIVPKTPAEAAAGRVWKNKVFREAAEIFLRLLNREIISADQIPTQFFTASDFRTTEQWEQVCAAYEGKADAGIPVTKQWEFERIKIIPQDWRNELVRLIIGSHDPNTQDYVNTFAPVKVFNLSITRPEIIDETHARMANTFHKDGGPWKRAYMPRTVFVFINNQPHLTPDQQTKKAHEEAESALGIYWTALEGTLDPGKVTRAANNALIGNPADVAKQIVERFHPDDRLMLWFDFFNHDSARVVQNMEAFKKEVAPLVAEYHQN